MTENEIQVLSDGLATSVLRVESVTGGDIAQVYRMETSSQTYLLKRNTGPAAAAMIRTERLGLAAMEQTHTVGVPQVYREDTLSGQPVLLMAYIEHRPATAEDHARLGRALARMHLHTQRKFGWEQDNFIGRLPQSNRWHDHWVDFYVNERLWPQLQWALEQSLLTQKDTPTRNEIEKGCTRYFPQNVKPALLHGDLWSGNYLIATDGTPYLIDPAVYYGHNEVDLAMSRLFGGFGPAFYTAYHEVIPAEAGREARMDIYQLYYLLVHLNMFGASYRAGVVRILQQYF